MYVEYFTRLNLHDVNSGILHGDSPVVLGCKFYLTLFHGANSVCLPKCMFVLYQTSERGSCVFYKLATLHIQRILLTVILFGEGPRMYI